MKKDLKNLTLTEVECNKCLVYLKIYISFMRRGEVATWRSSLLWHHRFLLVKIVRKSPTGTSTVS